MKGIWDSKPFLREIHSATRYSWAEIKRAREFNFRSPNPNSGLYEYFGFYNIPEWINRMEVEQYICEKDSTGMQIYEGDIIAGGGLEKPGKVVYHAGYFSVKAGGKYKIPLWRDTKVISRRI